MKLTDEKLIDRWIDSHRDEMVEELKAWVSHPSVSRADLAKPKAPYGPDCRRMLDFALERAGAFGFETEDYDGYCGAVLWGGKEAEYDASRGVSQPGIGGKTCSGASGKTSTGSKTRERQSSREGCVRSL